MRRREFLAAPAAAKVVKAATPAYEFHPLGIVITSNDTRAEGSREVRRAGMSALATVSVRPYTDVKWEMLRNGKPLRGAVLWQRGIDAAVRFPEAPGEVVLRASAGAARVESRFEVRDLPGGSWPAPEGPTAANPGARLQRAMGLLADGKPARVLFYGQSITKQDWWWQVMRDLERRFPKSRITYDNRALGGYSSPYLIRTVERDVGTFDPDLVIFHVYGPQAEYERIIRWIRGHTRAEVAIQNDHVNAYPENEQQKQRDRQSFEFLPKLCGELGCELVDIRRPWRAYLRTHNLRHQDLQKDGVHLNERGNWLMAELTKPYLWRIPGVRAPEPAKPAPFDEFSYTRPTLTWDADWPCLNRVEWATKPVAEDWRLRITEAAADLSSFRFSLEGSVTGADGGGVSTEKFVSKSGRVVIHPEDWAMKRSYDLRKQPMPADWEVWWSTLPVAKLRP